MIDNLVLTRSLAPVPVEITIPQFIEEMAEESGVNPKLARRIAFCESTFRQFTAGGLIIRGKRNPADVGLFQINEQYHLTKSRELGFDIYTLEGNLSYALWLLQNEGTKHWRWSQSCWKK